ncbi:Multicopper oxidase [hydrothermal vent metagenome]|uniref:Multicopper oxidase n=1 Tax=hydrothermal vent metagenome TaxID=652676 RepID=A0A3B1A320_9ZZZZ
MGRRRGSSSSGMGGSGGGTSNSGGGTGGGGMGGACYTYPGAPATPGLTTADITFNRGIYMNGSMRMDDGRNVTMWGFTDGGGDMGGGMGGSFPSPAIRVNQGQIVHTVLSNPGMMWLHTIHHHGIEPSTENDGVGHTSFDVQGTYTYQWLASHAGTYFYHCHTNTPLHAEMGMYGALIVDPPDGPGRVFEGGPGYDVEAIWAVDEIDSSWRGNPWNAGTCGGDVGLHDLNPDYFIITGVDGAQSALTDSSVAVDMNRGDTLLVRYINAGFLPQTIRFGGLTGSVVSSDGRAFPNAIDVTSLDTVSAERYDILFNPSSSGTYTVEIDIKHWVTGDVLGTARTRINVN